jgi:hypothetical protein
VIGTVDDSIGHAPVACLVAGKSGPSSSLEQQLEAAILTLTQALVGPRVRSGCGARARRAGSLAIWRLKREYDFDARARAIPASALWPRWQVGGQPTQPSALSKSVFATPRMEDPEGLLALVIRSELQSKSPKSTHPEKACGLGRE